MLVVHAMLLGSLQWTILTQVKLALSTGKIFAVYVISMLEALTGVINHISQSKQKIHIGPCIVDREHIFAAN